ncbi:hypothetical protein HY933_00865 [Candidatus Falkowbacteria bacterium]|nr:hypothetical protein [Candidatus Falkowbacteria bacterium]
MFDFLKKNKSSAAPAKTPTAKPATTISPEDIKVMPEKFYVVNATGMSRRVKIGIAVVVAVAVIGGAAVFFSIDWSARTAPTINTNAAVPAEPVPSPEPVQPETLTPAEQPMGEVPVVTNTNQPMSPSYEAEEVVPLPMVNSDKPVNGPDADGDGLTDAEEILYHTGLTKPDTDADGYLDGQEVKAGFHPNAARIGLAGSDLVSRYENLSFKYSILYPTAWKMRAVDEVGAQVLFQPEDSREFVEVIMIDRVPSLVSWYKQYVTPGSANEPLVSSLNSWQAIVSPDGLTFYLGRWGTDKVYILNYNPAGVKEINFQATFTMMVNSFISLDT